MERREGAGAACEAAPGERLSDARRAPRRVPVTRGRRFGVRSPINGRGRRLPGAPLRARIVGGRTLLRPQASRSTALSNEQGAAKIIEKKRAGISSIRP